MLKSKKIKPRVPEGEAIEDLPEFTMEELSESFKKRMWEYRSYVKFILKKFIINDYSKVLEIGPGPGWITILLTQANPTLKIIGLEISEDMIRVANQNKNKERVGNKIEFIKGDAKNMNIFEDKSFDVVISSDSLHHWENPIKVFDEIHRVLKDNGKVCIKDGRRDIGVAAKFVYNMAKLFISKTMSYYWKTSIMAAYTPDELKDLLDHSQLKDKYEIKTDLFDLLVYSR
jgi:ubiquinone/menaquinone biosynthesis C-methylase UbiE